MSGQHAPWATSISLYGTIREPFYLTYFLTSASEHGRLIYRYHTHPNLPYVDYPEGFQGTEIPVYPPTVVQVIEERIAGLHPI